MSEKLMRSYNPPSVMRSLKAPGLNFTPAGRRSTANQMVLFFSIIASLLQRLNYLIPEMRGGSSSICIFRFLKSCLERTDLSSFLRYVSSLTGTLSSLTISNWLMMRNVCTRITCRYLCGKGSRVNWGTSPGVAGIRVRNFVATPRHGQKYQGNIDIIAYGYPHP